MKNRVRTGEEAKADAAKELGAEKPSSAKERARRAAHVAAYKEANPVKAEKKLLSKDGKTLITLDEWVDEA